MTAKEYLSQAMHLDKAIDKKLEYMERLKAQATKATATISDMPGASSRDVTAREVVIAKLIDLEDEINQDIDQLVDLKRKIVKQIDRLEEVKCRELLMDRYILAYSWEQIAREMGCTVRYVYKLHGRALDEFTKVQ